MSTLVRCLALVGALALGVLAAPAAVPKAISSLPAEIQIPGRYVLANSLVFSNATALGGLAAITISCNDVVLDLADWTLECGDNLGVSQDVVGIRADFRRNITIRNGTLRGFSRAIYLEGDNSTGGHLVENVHADRCTFLGIQVKGSGSIVRRNRVTAIGGSTVNTAARYGLHLTGSALKVLDNEVVEVPPFSQGTKSYGILLNFCGNSVVQGNRVITSVLPFTPNHVNTGIYCISSGAILLAQNFVAGWNDGFGFAESLQCVIRDNTVANCSINYFGAQGQIDAGGNL